MIELRRTWWRLGWGPGHRGATWIRMLIPGPFNPLHWDYVAFGVWWRK